jgi:transmembrane sensor
MDDLLVKQLTGEATTEERALVQQWLAEDPSNQHYYEHFKLIWEESAHLTTTLSVDENAAWQRFQHRVENNPAKKGRPGRVFFMNSPLMRIAAMLVLVTGIGWLAWSLLGKNAADIPVARIQSLEETKKDTLPDGSFVTLNKRSEIAYPTRFTGKERVVNMKGEAFFNVAHDTSKPFIIHANDITVQVVGTSFNVRSQADSTEIIVETGIVRVSGKNQTIVLKAGEKVTIGGGKSTMEKEESTDQLYNYYRSRKFNCDGTPLWRLVEILNEAYDTHIEIGREELRDLPLTTTFNNEPLDSILNVINRTQGITWQRENGRIILR